MEIPHVLGVEKNCGRNSSSTHPFSGADQNPVGRYQPLCYSAIGKICFKMKFLKNFDQLSHDTFSANQKVKTKIG